MANADEFCQFARLGQTSKIQKCLQTHSVDVNALNLYGESALSTATYHNQILSVEYLLANKADPKLRLSAGHTAIHIACRLANVPILHLLLSIKKAENNGDEEEQHQEKVDRHMYDCLRIEDNAYLTPIHWAATQESVSKRQKVFAYLDQRMPGVLDSRYNINWFNSWAKTHPWVIEKKSAKTILAVSPVRLLPKLTNTDKAYRQYCEQGLSLPLTEVTSLDMTLRTSLHDYECTPRPPQTATTNGYYDDRHEQKKRISSKIRHIQAEYPPNALPPTPITSRIVASTQHIPKREHRELPCTQKQLIVSNNMSATSQKTPYSQRLSSIMKPFLSPLSDRSTYRAERAHVIPTLKFPPSPDYIDNKTNKGHDYEDMITPVSSKRPSHNLLSNIVPSTTTSSSDQSSGQSAKPFASFGFDTSINPRGINDTTTLSTIETYEQNDDESLFDDGDNDYESNHFDYICKSASTLGISTPGASTYDA